MRLFRAGRGKAALLRFCLFMSVHWTASRRSFGSRSCVANNRNPPCIALQWGLRFPFGAAELFSSHINTFNFLQAPFKWEMRVKRNSARKFASWILIIVNVHHFGIAETHLPRDCRVIYAEFLIKGPSFSDPPRGGTGFSINRKGAN